MSRFEGTSREELAAAVAALPAGEIIRLHYIMATRLFPANGLDKSFTLMAEALPDCVIRSDHASFDVVITRKSND